jgi:hypothetical protein
VKAHHPDRGGDTARFVELLAAVDRVHTGPEPAPTDTRGRPSGSRRRRRQAVRRFRQRLPRHIPGARRYATY